MVGAPPPRRGQNGDGGDAMSARQALWWLLPLSPLGIVAMLVGNGLWDWLGFALAAIPVLAGLFVVTIRRRGGSTPSPESGSPR